MAGLLVFIIIGGYAVFSIILVVAFIKNTPKRWSLRLITGVVTTFIVTLPVTTMYWEYVQTKRSFERYCKEEAKVTIFKTVEQWKKENPGVAKTLKPYTYENKPPYQSSGDGLYNTSSTDFLNPRFAMVRKESIIKSSNIFKRINEVVDTRTGEVMMRWIDFESGYGNPFLGTPYGWKSYKVWLAQPSCSNYSQNQSKFSAHREALINIRNEHP